MHLPRLFERWAGPEAVIDLVKRQRTTTPLINLPTLTAQPTTTDAPETTKADPTTANTPTTTAQTTQQPAQTTSKPPSTTAAPTTTQPASTNKPTTSAPPATTSAPPSVTSQTSVPSNTVAPSNTIEQISSSTASSTAAASKDSGGFGGVNGKSVATGVGVVAGVVGGFAVILLAVYMWRRHQRRKEMERIGSMEELPRAPSPGLARSYTRGHGPRQPIDDDDDDDFLTPMDTLPNTVRLDEWNSTKSSPTGSEAMYDDKSVYAESVYQEDLAYDNGPMGDEYPMPPPPAMTASNGRYYSGDFTGMSSQGPAPASSSSSGNGAIPTYSAMNKYAAYSAGASAPSNMSNQRPGGGYRAHDSYDAGGYV